jgi:hypothetical protein
LKRKRVNFKINPTQLQLVTDLFNIGAKAKSMKVSAEEAVQIFQCKGTIEGQAR